MNELAQLFSLLSDETRLKLLVLISQGEKCVCTLHKSIGVQQSVASRHLALLRAHGLVTARRQGTWMHYQLSPETWRPVWKDLLPFILQSAQTTMESGGTPLLFCQNDVPSYSPLNT